MGLPIDSNSARTLADSSASFSPNGIIFSNDTKDAICCFHFVGFADLAAPTSSSYKTIDGTAMSFGDFDNRFLATLPASLKK